MGRGHAVASSDPDRGVWLDWAQAAAYDDRLRCRLGELAAVSMFVSYGVVEYQQ
jgi:hypothetical protein